MTLKALLPISVAVFLWAQISHGNGPQPRSLVVALENANRFVANTMRQYPNESLFRQINEKLRTVNIEFPPLGRTFEQCQILSRMNGSFGQTQAFTERFLIFPGNTVTLCSHPDQWSINGLAVVLIHESIHLLGIFNECTTTRWEALVIQTAKIPNAFRSAHYSSCGIPFPQL